MDRSEDALYDLMSAPPATFEDLLAKARFYYRRGDGSHLLHAAADFMDALCTVAIGHPVRLQRPIGTEPRLYHDPDKEIPPEVEEEIERLAGLYHRGAFAAVARWQGKVSMAAE